VTTTELKRTAEAHLRAGRTDAAIAAYRAVLASDDRDAEACYNLGWLCRQTRDFDSALAAYADALARGIAQPEAVHVNRAAILSEQLQRYAEAETELRQALSCNPRFVPAWLNLGNLHEDRGDLSAARDAYVGALRIDAANGRAHAQLTVLDIHAGDLARAAARLDKARQLARHDPVGDAEFAHAEAQLIEAQGDYPRAFAAIAAANARAHALIPPHLRYDPARQDALIDALIAAPTWPEAPVETLAPRPLFVTGMFRSGSTLCETQLARHSRVTSGGELDLLPAAIAAIPNYPSGPVDPRALRQRYAAALARLFPAADLVTDKRPDNFLHLGLIAAMYPETRIVHSVRDPVDTALSIFFLYFEDSVAYGARLKDIVHYMRGYRRLMRHWQARLGARIVTFDYDAFVAAPEETARALFAELDLSWEDGCSPRAAAAGTVRTPSAWAVRQPVHRRSSGRWRHYARELAAVKAAFDAD
jgi:tetratricopeptide (TPR) repeat protein